MTILNFLPLAVLIAVVVALWATAGLMLWVRFLPTCRICAWCQMVMAGGTLPATHGICLACRQKEGL